MAQRRQQNNSRQWLAAPAAWVGRGLWLVCTGGLILLAISCDIETPAPPPAEATPTVKATPTVSNTGSLVSKGNMLLGTLETASAIAADHHPTTITNIFTPSSTIYAVFTARNLPAGTGLYAQWLHDGQVYDNSPPLVAQQDYDYIYIEFHIQALPDKPPPPKGNYKVQIYVNGNAGPRADFVVH